MDLRKDLPEPGLGDLVQCKITGYEGIVTSVTSFVAGCERVAVKSQEMYEGKPIESQLYDSPNLTVVKRRAVKGARRKKSKVELGEKAQDKITGFTGIVNSRTERLFGNATIGIVSQSLGKNGVPEEPVFFDESMLKKVKEEKLKPEKRKATGGDQRIPSQYL